MQDGPLKDIGLTPGRMPERVSNRLNILVIEPDSVRKANYGYGIKDTLILKQYPQYTIDSLTANQALTAINQTSENYGYDRWIIDVSTLGREDEKEIMSNLLNVLQEKQKQLLGTRGRIFIGFLATNPKRVESLLINIGIANPLIFDKEDPNLLDDMYGWLEREWQSRIVDFKTEEPSTS